MTLYIISKIYIYYIYIFAEISLYYYNYKLENPLVVPGDDVNHRFGCRKIIRANGILTLPRVYYMEAI